MTGESDDVKESHNIVETESRCDHIRTKVFPTPFWPELAAMCKLAFPLMAFSLFRSLPEPITLIFAGHLGTYELAAVSLSNTLINVTGNAIAVGLSFACETIFSQTYGSENRKGVGVQFQRSILIYILAVVPLCAIQLNTRSLLLLLGQDPEVSRLADLYMVTFIPGSIFMFMNEVVRTYLSCQNIVLPNMFIGFICVAVNAVLQYLVLYQLGMGVEGAALALDATYALMFILNLAYTIVMKLYKETWDGWSWDCLREWDKFMSLAIPALMMICLEWWAWEITVFLSGLLGTSALSAQTVVVQVDFICYVIPAGVSSAVSIRVGQWLGAGKPDYARTASRVGFIFLGITSLLVAAIIGSLKNELPKMFTSDQNVIDYSSSLLPIVAFYTFFDNISAVGRAIFRGTGKQFVGFVLCLISYYCVGLPIGIPLMLLTSSGLAGLWWSFSGALVINATTFTIACVWMFNWDKLATEARVRAGVSILEVHERNIIDVETPEETKPLVTTEKKESQNDDNRGTAPTNSTNHSKNDFTEIVCIRIVTLLIFVFLLGCGIFFRVYIEHPDVRRNDLQNTTMLPQVSSTHVNHSQLLLL